MKEHIKKADYSEGMGISGMYERVNKLRGNINITVENGFRIFISVKKEAKKKEGKDEDNYSR